MRRDATTPPTIGTRSWLAKSSCQAPVWQRSVQRSAQALCIARDRRVYVGKGDTELGQQLAKRKANACRAHRSRSVAVLSQQYEVFPDKPCCCRDQRSVLDGLADWLAGGHQGVQLLLGATVDAFPSETHKLLPTCGSSSTARFIADDLTIILVFEQPLPGFQHVQTRAQSAVRAVAGWCELSFRSQRADGGMDSAFAATLRLWRPASAKRALPARTPAAAITVALLEPRYIWTL